MDAVSLATEQCMYAPGIVWQGTETATVLASAVLDAETWFFWWD